MTNEVVVSPVKDVDFKTNLGGSPVWKNCYHADEVTDDIRKKHAKWFEYHVKFDGLKPVQLTKTIEK